MLVPRHRSGVLHRARDGYSGAETRHGSGRTAAEEFHQGGAVPVSLRTRLGIRFRRLPHRHAQDDGDRSTMPVCARSRRHSAPRSSAARPARSWASACRSSPRSSAPARRRIATSWALRCSIPAKSACIRPVRASPASAPRARARVTRPPGRRSSRPRSAFPPTTSWWRRATPIPRLTGSAPTARARRRWRALRSPWRRARSRPRRR